MATFSDLESMASVRAKINAAITKVDDAVAIGNLTARRFDTVPELLAYSATPRLTVGTYVEAGGFRYLVVSSGEHLTTAGGDKLTVVPLYVGSDGGVVVSSMVGAVGDNATDDTDALNLAATVARALNAKLVLAPVSRSLGYYITSTLDFTDLPFIDGRSAIIRSTISGSGAVQIGKQVGVVVDGDIWLELISSTNSAVDGTYGVHCYGLRTTKLTLGYAQGYDDAIYFDGLTTSNRNWLNNDIRIARASNCGTLLHIALNDGRYFISNEIHVESYLGSGTKKAKRAAVKLMVPSGTPICSDNRLSGGIGLDGGSYHADSALLFYAENSGTSGNHSFDFSGARIETYTSGGAFATDPYLVRIPVNTNVASRIHVGGKLTSISIGDWLVDVGTVNNSLDFEMLVPWSINNSQAAMRARPLPPEFYQTATGCYVTNRVMWDGNFTTPVSVITGGVSARTTRAIGDQQFLSTTSTVGYGLRWNKLTGAASFLRLPQTMTVIVICYNSSGTVIGGSAPYYATGTSVVTGAFGGADLYRMNTKWVYLHPDVASFDLISCSYTGGQRRLVDVQNFEVTIGDDLTPDFYNASGPGLITDTATIRTMFPVGTALDGTATNGWRNTARARTTVSVAASSGASTIDVASITGISNGDIIAIELDTVLISAGSERQWFHTTVNGAPAGSTITLTATLPADVAIGRRVQTARWTAR
jgi:hypothetical protein